jgi:hypothetical protein
MRPRKTSKGATGAERAAVDGAGVAGAAGAVHLLEGAPAHAAAPRASAKKPSLRMQAQLSPPRGPRQAPTCARRREAMRVDPRAINVGRKRAP